MIKCCCLICRKEFSHKGIFTHLERTHGTSAEKAKYSSGYNGKYNDSDWKKKVKAGNQNVHNEKLGEYKEFTVCCDKVDCGKKFIVVEREKKFPKKEKYYCSRKCANTRNHTEKSKNKIKKSIKNFHKDKEIAHPKKRNKQNRILKEHDCIICSSKFMGSGKVKACSPTCSTVLRSRNSRENSNCGGKRNSHRIKYKQTDGKIITLESSYEVSLAKDLDKNNIRWKRPEYIFYTDNKGKQRRYYPDFYLIDLDVYLDPKNDYLITKDRLKIESVAKQNNIRIFVLSKDQLTFLSIQDILLKL